MNAWVEGSGGRVEEGMWRESEGWVGEGEWREGEGVKGRWRVVEGGCVEVG